MIKDADSIEKVTYENLHGGHGSVHISHYIKAADDFKGLDVFATVTLAAGASIGYHIHTTDSEAYYILEGQGTFIDHGEIEKEVQAGDLCIITKGQGHGLKNTGQGRLICLAVVWS